MATGTHMTLLVSKKRILFTSLLAAICLLAAGCSNGADNSDPILDFPPAKAAAAGLLHTCALHEGGSVSCWGDNRQGQLGNGAEPTDFGDPSFDPSETEMGSAVPVVVKEISDSAAIDAGFLHTCALHRTGRVSCWGENSLGQLGNGESGEEALSYLPVSVSSITDATDIATGGRHSCTLHSDATISCWGNNYFGQLGNGESGREFFGADTPDGFVFSDLPVQVPGIDDAIDVAAGRSHTCALHQDGTVSCWGHNDYGQLGYGSTGLWRYSVTPQKIEGVEGIIALATGEGKTCLLHEAGTVSCWGAGQTSDDPESILKGIANAISIDIGGGHICVLRDDMTVLCWGYNTSGQLGNGEIYFGDSDVVEYLHEPVQVAGITDAVGIATGGDHTCAVHEDGTVSCWGGNWRGEIGNGTTDNYSNALVRVKNITNATSVSAAIGHTCALHDDATISCWGANEIGQLGNGQVGQGKNSAVPVKVQNISGATAAVAGGGGIDGRSCALHRDGTISCWGSQNSTVPAKIEGIKNAKAVTTGDEHTCALHEGGTISCWGYNDDGQLGNETRDYSAVPVQVKNITDAAAVDAGDSHTCALHRDGTVSCWGNNVVGQLGNGNSGKGEHSSAPVKVQGITNAIAVSASVGVYLGHTCALLEDRTISCWGMNSSGQLGTGQSAEGDISPIPAAVQGITDATAISTGDEHTCALHEGGTISCWGSNFGGRLGSFETADEHSALPVPVDGIISAIQITAGREHSCALHQDGTISCWGNMEEGRLGNGSSPWLPQKVIGLGG